MNGAPSQQPEIFPKRRGLFADVERNGRGDAVTWTHKHGDRYAVTGVTTSGKRFSYIYDNWFQASAINVWRGTKWLVRDGKRCRLQTISN